MCAICLTRRRTACVYYAAVEKGEGAEEIKEHAVRGGVTGSRLPFACGIMSGSFSKLSMLSALRGKVADLSRGDEAPVPDAARFAMPPSS